MEKQTQTLTRLSDKLLICVVAVMALSFYSCRKKEMPESEFIAKNAFSLSSACFTDRGEISPRCAARNYYYCTNFEDNDEEEHLNHSPQLSWKNAPKGTTSFFIIMEKSINDREISFWAYNNWHVYNIPANKTSLTENDQTIRENSNLYIGPYAPKGEINVCQITIYALDLPANYFDYNNYPPSSKAEIEQKLNEHILARTSITGTFIGK